MGCNYIPTSPQQMHLSYVMNEHVIRNIHNNNVSNAICYRTLRLAVACKTGKWRALLLHGELAVRSSHRYILIIYIYREIRSIFLNI
jgi:hypothetical protein